MSPIVDKGLAPSLCKRQNSAEMTGIDRLFVETRPDNAAALALYKKCGYTVFERTPDNVKMERNRSESV